MKNNPQFDALPQEQRVEVLRQLGRTWDGRSDAQEVLSTILKQQQEIKR